MNTSPDLHNSCSNGISSTVGVPQNLHGYQFARTGNSYAGIVSYVMNITTPGNAREYLQTQLLGTLVAGEEYFIQFFVSPGDSCKWVTNNIGLYFSQVEIDTVILPINPLPFLPQIENSISNDISDQNNWNEVSGFYTATGNEKYIIIGNFRNGVNSTGNFTGWGVNLPINFAVHFIDDVLVTPTDSLTSDYDAESETDLVLETHFGGATYQLSATKNTIVSYELINILGELIKNESNISANLITLNMESFAKGIYMLKVKLANHKIHIFKILRS
jgi:hypothetical protein